MKKNKAIKKKSAKQIRQKIKEKTRGLINNITDCILVSLAMGLYFILYPSCSLGRGMEDLMLILDGYDPRAFRKNFFRLRKDGYINKNNQLTKEGWEKIKSILPIYRKPKKWDGKWYLVIYDIPERMHRKRDILREKLKSLGYGKLQASVWISPLGYAEVIEKLADFHHLGPYVVISESASIGKEDSKILAEKIWRLDLLNSEYTEFIEKCRQAKFKKFEKKIAYWNVLKKDPQLPTDLLPVDWQGERAAKLVGEI